MSTSTNHKAKEWQHLDGRPQLGPRAGAGAGAGVGVGAAAAGAFAWRVRPCLPSATPRDLGIPSLKGGRKVVSFRGVC